MADNSGKPETIARIQGRHKPSPMACPTCGSPLNGVVETKGMSDNSIRRRRVCGSCEHGWHTVERALPPQGSYEVHLRPDTLRDPPLGGGLRAVPAAIRPALAVVPLALSFPSLSDTERNMLLIMRSMGNEQARVLLEVGLALAEQRIATVPADANSLGTSSADAR